MAKRTEEVCHVKRCSKCKEELPIEYFNRDRSTKDGFYPSCRSCNGCSRKGKSQAHLSERKLHWAQQQKLKYPERYLLDCAKKSARLRNLDFNLTVEDIKIPSHCPVFGTPFDFVGKKLPTSPSVDRVDNTKGYVKGNVRIISFKANLMKRDNTIETLKAILNYLESTDE